MTNQIIKLELNNFENRIYNIQNIVQKTILSAQKYKVYDIIGTNELNMCISTLETIFKDAENLLSNIKNNEQIDILTKIQNIESELLIILKNFGSDSIKDILNLLVGTNYIKEQLSNTYLSYKFNIINKCVHPINYKSMIWKNDNDVPNKKVIQKNRIVEDHMILDAENLECFDLARTSKSFQTKVYGIKVCIQDYKNKKTHIIACIVDDILLSCFNSEFIQTRLTCLNVEKPKDIDYNVEQWNRFISSLTLKELLGIEINDVRRKQISINYLEGLEWNFKYYNEGCPDWKWKYNYKYPPLLEDLYKFIPYFDTEFINKKVDDPVRPLVQLSYVLPRNSLHLLPPSIYEKLIIHHSEWYRLDYDILWAYCKYFWESHIVLPSIDIKVLEKLI